MEVLFALRSRALNCKANFKNKFKETDTLCPLCSREEDTQQHMMVCTELVKNLKSEKLAKGKIQYDHIYKDEKKQMEVTELFKELIEVRNKLEEDIQAKQLDPCTFPEVQRNGVDLLLCTDNYSSGK